MEGEEEGALLWILCTVTGACRFSQRSGHSRLWQEDWAGSDYSRRACKLRGGEGKEARSMFTWRI